MDTRSCFCFAVPCVCPNSLASPGAQWSEELSFPSTNYNERDVLELDSFL
jgi:hypothetical protein